MQRYLVGDLAAVGLEGSGPGSEDIMRWVSELASTRADGAIDIMWRPSHRAHAPSERRRQQEGSPPAVRTGDGSWECWGRGNHFLLMLQEVLLARGASLVHACAIEFSGRGVLLVARSGGGKTVAALSAVRDERVRLLSDDLVVMESNGKITAFPTQIAVRPPHRALLPPEVATRIPGTSGLAGVVRRVLPLPAARRIARSVRNRLVRSEGPLGGWARQVKSDYTAVPTRTLIPGDRLVAGAEIAVCILLEIGARDAATEVATEDAVNAILDETYTNEGLDAALERYASHGHIDLDQHRQRLSTVVLGFLEATSDVVRIEIEQTDDLDAAQRSLLGQIGAIVARGTG